mgnify:FL=1
MCSSDLTYEGFKEFESWPALSTPGTSTPVAALEKADPTGAASLPDKEAPARSDLETASAITPADERPAESISHSTSVSSPEAVFEEVEIRAGDSLVRIFKRVKLDIAQAIEISKVPGAEALGQLKPGPYLKIQRDGENVVSLRYQPNIKSYLLISAQNETFVAETIARAFDVEQREFSFEITDTLYDSARRAGLPNAVAHRITQIFQWEVDFSSDLHPGDRVTVIFEEQRLDGEKVGTGPILAVSLENDGEMHRAIRHVHADGSAAYFDQDGNSLQRAFLRSPIPGASVSSGFSYNRLHPILKVRRPHLGVDYGARKGTAIVATADGKVIRASRKGGYGKTIIIRHGQDYRTLYAHLSGYAKGIRSGKWVKKGQVIGYVGSTGFSTGPHLHYEIHVNGKAKNPQTIVFPRAASIGSKDKVRFLEQSKIWVSRLDELHQAG